MKRITTIIAAGLLVFGAGTAQAQDDARSMQQLLELIQQGQARDSQEARQREAEFARRKNEQQNLLNQARAERNRQERESERLEQSINLDVPFLMTERTDRLNSLKEIMERSDVSVAEKFRKVMEAYQIENDYGTTIERYKETLTLDDGTTRDYNMLRIGRIGLYFQSEDTNITGRWDNDSRQWVLDNDARNEVRKGLRIANQLIAPELILVPVSAPTEAQ